MNDCPDHYEYLGWQVQFELTGAGESLSAHVDLAAEGASKCRIALSSAQHSRENAWLALEEKARAFIDAERLGAVTSNQLDLKDRPPRRAGKV